MDWSELLAKHGRALVLYARQWAASHAEAEDAVQDAFVRLWRHRERVTNDPVPFLYTAVRCSAIDRGRSRSRREEREKKAALDLYTASPLFESGIEKEERRRQIEAALGTLPEEQREVLVMKVWAELTFRQIGEALGIPLNTAASRYRYALEALRDSLRNPAERARLPPGRAGRGGQG